MQYSGVGIVVGLEVCHVQRSIRFFVVFDTLGTAGTRALKEDLPFFGSQDRFAVDESGIAVQQLRFEAVLRQTLFVPICLPRVGIGGPFQIDIRDQLKRIVKIACLGYERFVSGDFLIPLSYMPRPYCEDCK